MGQPKRDWLRANEKRRLKDGRCLVCRKANAELAHVVGREHDRNPPLHEPRGWVPYWVVPDRVVLLCGPATDPHTCHGRYDNHQLDLLPYLTLDEQLQAVADAGGLQAAYQRLTGQRVPVVEAEAARHVPPALRDLP